MRSIVLVSMFVQNFIACCFICFMSSSPLIPVGNPGKFSTSVVSVSCPPGGNPPAINPSKRSVESPALAV